MGNIDSHLRSVLQAHKEELYERFQVESLSVFGSVSRGSYLRENDWTQRGNKTQLLILWIPACAGMTVVAEGRDSLG